MQWDIVLTYARSLSSVLKEKMNHICLVRRTKDQIISSKVISGDFILKTEVGGKNCKSTILFCV